MTRTCSQFIAFCLSLGGFIVGIYLLLCLAVQAI